MTRLLQKCCLFCLAIVIPANKSVLQFVNALLRTWTILGVLLCLCILAYLLAMSTAYTSAEFFLSHARLLLPLLAAYRDWLEQILQSASQCSTRLHSMLYVCMSVCPPIRSAAAAAAADCVRARTLRTTIT
jgi:hypothetical protein